MMISAFITTGGAILGTLGLFGFIIAAVGYVKTRSVETLNLTNDILKKEVDALSASRVRMQAELDEAKKIASETTLELVRVGARTDLTLHQKHLDNQHQETLAALTRIADESSERNGHIADSLVAYHETLAQQHHELVAGLSRIADESEVRNGHIASALLKITELVTGHQAS